MVVVDFVARTGTVERTQGVSARMRQQHVDKVGGNWVVCVTQWRALILVRCTCLSTRWALPSLPAEPGLFAT